MTNYEEYLPGGPVRSPIARGGARRSSATPAARVGPGREVSAQLVPLVLVEDSLQQRSEDRGLVFAPLLPPGVDQQPDLLVGQGKRRGLIEQAAVEAEHRLHEDGRETARLHRGPERAGHVGKRGDPAFLPQPAEHCREAVLLPIGMEWIGVIAAAAACGFLVAQVAVPDNPSLVAMNLALMVVQIVVGLLGFILHARGNLSNQAGSFWDRFVYGAPIFAPLLFADLALLAVLGCWAQFRCLAAGGGDPS